MQRSLAGIGILVLAAAFIATGCTRERDILRSAEAEAAYRARYETRVVPDGADVVASLDKRKRPTPRVFS